LKRILSLDGGGIRGVFSLQILARIEALFRAARANPALVLRDEFDFFAGTSTGAIIATYLAWGLSVQSIIDRYESQGKAMFTPAPIPTRWLRHKYSAEGLAGAFRRFFVEADGSPAQLGSQSFQHNGQLKYLLVVVRNASTGSAWPICNNPHGRYGDSQRPSENLSIPLWQLLRASTAAPTYFPPQSITIGGTPHLFVDGGFTPYNNPALIATLTATLPAYRIGWPTGVEKLQVVSVGTGLVRAHLPKRPTASLTKLDFAGYVPHALISGVMVEQDLICRVLGECRHGAPLDRELGDLHTSGLLSPAEKKFSYLRYDQTFTQAEIDHMQSMTGQPFALDNLALIPELKRLGSTYAEANGRPEHFDLI
jgi:uncharacterized protein